MVLDFEQRLAGLMDGERIKKDEPMKKHVTFRVGGNADYFVTVKNADEIAAVINLCKEEKVPYFIMGNGSNLLVGDKGIRGVVIQIAKDMNEIEVDGETITAMAGALLSKIAGAALNAGLTGLEFASGIPGTLGGAVVMNAGAYGGEMKDVLDMVRVLTPEGEILELGKDALKLGYRTSVVAEKNYIVLDARIVLKKDDKEKIREYMEDLKGRRTSKQPLEYPSAGSTFKRPEGYFAGKLIDDAGLRGFALGGAQVSEKHCGFVINKDNATALEIIKLIEEVQKRVKENSGVALETEVKKVGEF
ncbi:UDP-N-acetylmuramate dehydrogenase [Lachnoclostridium sp. An181]|uniref:UDP-N-acetylmuramate dehydrogenase n=1 Tax=Lachnoclostridium sp. An181 TaxID=1965575 RepID=UPI000B39C8CD|nr:UDP-N-acetylmuramate dehydrogenase [Lachnoclostridium sp. An181]OUP49513.1 UDP-N-acetylenolpyruvoylglucosamine reductase [Lachnoclostridium sp. An181]